MNMTAKSVSHGVIRIESKGTKQPVADASPTGTNTNVAAGSHPINDGAAPPVVIIHKTAEQIATEAANLAADVQNMSK